MDSTDSPGSKKSTHLSINPLYSSGVSTPNNTTPPNEIHNAPDTTFKLITWSPSDPENPQNWPRRTKLLRSTAPLAVIFSIAFASSIFGASATVTAKEYGVSQELMSLGVALFIAGFALGPLLWAPLAEVIGNAPILAIALTGCAIFQIPLALAKNVATILISRFLAGLFGAGGLAVGSGVLADIFGPITRGIAVGTSASIMNLGSIIGPIAGAYLVASGNAGWRWTAWATLILCCAAGVLFFTMTWYKKRWVAAQRAEIHGEKDGSKGHARIAPEDRLPPMILGAVLLPPSLLWFGWSGDTHWASQVISCFFLGMSLQIIFISGIVYIVDVYFLNTVSAISIHVMVRSLVSATFPLFEGPMYESLHINYSATLLAALSALIMVSPILLRIYGSQIRTWSRFSS
ncbi:hypothetical protein N7504_010140 [Penicillium tannophilum]|nr:hypothetical protein N7504_010140 [Penicillium tannophilum]